MKYLILNLLIVINIICSSAVGKTSINQSSIDQSNNIKISDYNDDDKDTYQKIIADFYLYDQALKDLSSNNYFLALRFLSTQKKSNSMSEILRLRLLKVLGDNNISELFLKEFHNLSKEEVGKLNQDIFCYYYLFNSNYNQDTIDYINKLKLSNEKFTDSCIKLYGYGFQKGLISINDIWRRIWILLYYDQITGARFLSALINSPLPQHLGIFKKGTIAEQVGLMYLVISPKNRNKYDVDLTLKRIANKLNLEQLAFVHGVLGISKAKDLNFNDALLHYNYSKEKYFSLDQWQWLARSFLRVKNWNKLNIVIDIMPKEISDTPTWKYWKAKSLENINNMKNDSVISLYDEVSKSGRNFYAVLANEELGRPLNINNNVNKVNKKDILKIANYSAIDKSLVLFKESEKLNNPKIRIAAQDQWRYAVRNYDENMLIIASQLALENHFYEMAIYSADRTDYKLNFNLRYLYPYKNIITKYANKYDINRSWVFGIVRQESRFIHMAKSSMGALGLMQIMPRTSKFIAKKLGIHNYDVYDIDTNINMGVWYLSYIFQDSGSYVLATAGYNAGKDTVKKWQDNTQYLDASIYIETIPFNETRDYVKKVMTNLVYYANLLHDKKRSLKDFLSVIPPRQ